jgi:pectin methylesterase-like acyl-CoA thioesterase
MQILINSVYTVGGSSADFSTISEALDVISYCGVSTPTIISIKPGVYNENIIIPSIHGTSEANTLTITSANGDLHLLSYKVLHPHR